MKKLILVFIFSLVSNIIFSQSTREKGVVDFIGTEFMKTISCGLDSNEVDYLTGFLLSFTDTSDVCYLNEFRYNSCNQSREEVLDILNGDLLKLVWKNELIWKPIEWGYDGYGGWFEMTILCDDYQFKLAITFGFRDDYNFYIKSYSPYYVPRSNEINWNE
jgi:hypothetical protein